MALLIYGQNWREALAKPALKCAWMPLGSMMVIPSIDEVPVVCAPPTGTIDLSLGSSSVKIIGARGRLWSRSVSPEYLLF